jgi:hypothetical protein
MRECARYPALQDRAVDLYFTAEDRNGCVCFQTRLSERSRRPVESRCTRSSSAAITINAPTTQTPSPSCTTGCCSRIAPGGSHFAEKLLYLARADSIQFREGEARLMKSFRYGTAAFLPISLRHFVECRVYFPTLVKGGQGGWSVSNQAHLFECSSEYTIVIHPFTLIIP